MTLDRLKPGQSANVLRIREQGALRRHFLDMGLTPGTIITLQKTAPMGDPVELMLRGYTLTLRLDDAKKIEVQERLLSDQPAAYWHASKPGRTEPYRVNRVGPPIPAGKPVTFALVGNQNCGKTTLFNQLTGANQHVGNFPGVTVDQKDGILRAHPEATVTDLPGIYSLSPYSSEEVVTRDFLLHTRPSGIINIVDASHIERNLYLTMQVMELGIPMVLALNMMDEIRANHGSICISKLEEILGIPVIPIAAVRNEGIDELITCAMRVARNREAPGQINFCTDTGRPGDPVGAVSRCMQAAVSLLEPCARRAGVPVRFAAAKMVEGDSLMQDVLDLTPAENAALNRSIRLMERESGLDREAALAHMRFSLIERFCLKTVVRPEESREHKRSVAIDRILTGKYTAIPCFLGIMAFVFVMTFRLVGPALSGMLSSCVNAVMTLAAQGLTAAQVHPVVYSLVIDGVCNGIGSVFSFLPTIVTLFFFLSILEDTGYLARVAFIMDKILRHIGLSGRSFVPLLIGFGCSVPAMMATRTLSSERDRDMTILLTPFMSCSAKLPVYGLLTGAFFPPRYQALIVTGFYLFGIFCSILYALLLQRIYRGEPVPFVMELPQYRLPGVKSVARLLWDKARGFIRKAFTIIFAATVTIWFLQTFDSRLHIAASPDTSLLAMVGGLLAPVFAPLGLGDWRVSAALLSGFTAKENVVSALTVLLGGDVTRLPVLFTPFTAVVFLVFTLLYTPCAAAIATVRREMDSVSAAVFIAVTQCAIAWLIAFAVHSIGQLLGFA